MLLIREWLGRLMVWGGQVDPVPGGSEAAPLDALSDVADTATEAATDFVSWVTSGQLDALYAVMTLIAATVALYAFRWATERALTKIQTNDELSVIAIAQRLIHRFRPYFMFSLALNITDWLFDMPSSVESAVQIFSILAAVLQVAEWVQEAAISSVRRSARQPDNDATSLASAINVIKLFINIAIWSIAILLILSNIGSDVTALLAGLGIGGLAIGLAAQGVVGDVFSALGIIFDKPFQRGDVIKYADTWGSVEDIGLKTTRIRSMSGEQIIVSNTKLLDQEIHNMRRMVRRRIETGFGVVYDTAPDTAEMLPGLVASIIKEIPGVDFDRCSMSGFGNSSLDYEVVFYSLNPDFNRSMAARSKVLLAIFRAFKARNIEFAFPTQTLHLRGVEDGVGDDEDEVYNSAVGIGMGEPVR